ncbi:MAG: glycosyltransferase [Bryobacteraceae bacterium]
MERNGHPVRLLIVANVAAMFRDFLNPFGAHFRAKGWRVDAVASDISGSPECRGVFDHVWDVNWSRNPFTLANLTNAPRTVRKIVQEAGYELVHVHTPVPAFVTRYAFSGLTNGSRPKLIYTAHGFHFHPHGSAWKNQAFLSLERTAGRWTDYLVVINRIDEEYAKSYRLVPQEKIVYMPGIGLNRAFYRPEMVSQTEVHRIGDELGLGANEPIILMIAEFTPGKRHRDALKAFARLGSARAHLVLAGEGPLLDATRKFAIELGVSNKVHFLGFRRDITALMRSSTLSVLPSEREGLPKSIMEALCMELPVVGTDIRGIQDLLGGGAGLLVPLGDTNRLAEAMRWVLEYPEQAKAMARAGRARIEQHYDLDHILRLHEELYERALSGTFSAHPRTRERALE